MKSFMRPLQEISAAEIKASNASPAMRSRLIFGAAVGDCPKSRVKIQPLPTLD